MKTYRNPLIFVAILLALLAIISAYLAYAQAALLDRYLKRLMVEPDFSQFLESNQVIIWFSAALLVGQVWLWWLMGRWLVQFQDRAGAISWLWVPVVQIFKVYRLATITWASLEYKEKEANEFHRYQRWSHFYAWIWSMVAGLLLMAIGLVWLASLPEDMAIGTSTSAMTYALVVLTVGHALAALSLLFTMAIVRQMEGKASG